MNPILFQTVDKLGFQNIRVVNALQNADINYAGELVQKLPIDLLKVKNFGSASLKVVVERLVELKLKLGMKIQWPQREAYDARIPSQDQWYGIQQRYKHAVKALLESNQPVVAGIEEDLVLTVLPTTCPRHPQAGVWISTTGRRCAICSALLNGTPPPVSQPLRSILNWQRLTHALATEKGFYDERPLNFGDQISLMHCELSEVFEEYRKGKGPKEVYIENGKPEGIPIEFADVVLRVMQWTHELGIDLESAMCQKHVYNMTRERLHGKKI